MVVFIVAEHGQLKEYKKKLDVALDSVFPAHQTLNNTPRVLPKEIKRKLKPVRKYKQDIHVALIVCRKIEKAMTLIKTIILFTKAKIHFHLVRQKELESKLVAEVRNQI